MKLRLTIRQKRRASTCLALALSELEGADLLLKAKKYREAVAPMYGACFRAGQALLADRLPSNPKHQAVETALHKSSKFRSLPPRAYTRLHKNLFQIRNTVAYKSAGTPNPNELLKCNRLLQRYLRYVTRRVPRIEMPDILSGLVQEHKGVVEELSFDIYHPRPYYGGQTRLTVWQPAAGVRSFSPDRLIRCARRFLADILADFPKGYVVGLNSRLNQYGLPVHLLMLDLDTTDPAVEHELKTIGGILVKSGRGFHFIGNSPIRGPKRWESTLRRLARRKNLRRLLDTQHIDYSLERGYSTLRLTAGPDKPHTPFFYKEL